MFKFSDGLGRTHTLDVSVVTLSKVNDETGVDFAACKSAEAFAELCQKLEPPLVACKVMAILAGEPFEQHGKGWNNGDIVEAGQRVLLELAISYLPSEIRPVIQSAFSKLCDAQADLHEQLTKLWDSPQVKDAIDRTVSEAIGGGSDA